MILDTLTHLLDGRRWRTLLPVWPCTRMGPPSPSQIFFPQIFAPPPIPVFRDGVIFDLSKFFDFLHSSLCAERSPILPALLSLPSDLHYDNRCWEALCLDSAICLSIHRCACELRSMLFLPRLFDLVPNCKFCDALCGAHPGHWNVCPSLYMRLCRALPEVIPLLLLNPALSVSEVRDLTACFEHPNGSFLLLLSSEFDAARKVRHFSTIFPHPILLLTWSGLFAVSSNFPFPVPRALRVSLCHTVLQQMCRPVAFSYPPSSAILVSSSVAFDPIYSVLSVPLRSQQILAWLLRYDHRCRVDAYLFQFDIPVSCLDFSHPSSVRVHLCTLNTCFSSWPPPADQCSVVICHCAIPSHQAWQVVLCGADFIILASRDYSLSLATC